jgi:16S rRNA (guanine966-N2)-methyltransferase
MPPFNLAFLDPPYGQGLAEKALIALAEGKWLVPGAIIVAEERAGTSIALPAPFAELDKRTYGDTEIVIAKFSRADTSK